MTEAPRGEPDEHVHDGHDLSSVYATPAFWERFWCPSGIQFVVLFIIASFVGRCPHPILGRPSHAILLARVISGINVLDLLWFAAALRTTLADAGHDGCGA